MDRSVLVLVVLMVTTLMVASLSIPASVADNDPLEDTPIIDDKPDILPPPIYEQLPEEPAEQLEEPVEEPQVQIPELPEEPPQELESPEKVPVTYNHPSGVGSSDKDCFGDSAAICITRDVNEAPYNAGTTGGRGIEWGCGPCDDVSDWYSELNTRFKSGCVAGHMPNIVGEEICLKTSTDGLWDVLFHSFESGGGGGFSYTRIEYLA